MASSSVTSARRVPMFWPRLVRWASVREVAKYPWILPHQGNLHRHRLQLAFEAEGIYETHPSTLAAAS